MRSLDEEVDQVDEGVETHNVGCVGLNRLQMPRVGRGAAIRGADGVPATGSMGVYGGACGAARRSGTERIGRCGREVRKPLVTGF